MLRPAHAASLARTLYVRLPKEQELIDVTAISGIDLAAGIELMKRPLTHEASSSGLSWSFETSGTKLANSIDKRFEGRYGGPSSWR